MAAIRYYSITSPHGKVVHKYYGKKLVEGEKLACGARLGLHWRWTTRKIAGLPFCTNCLRAA